MPNLQIPEEIHSALALKTADRYNIPFQQAYAWITDIERKGTQSIFFEQVKPIALDLCRPILSAIMPAIQDIVSAAIAAGIIQARAINDADYGTDIARDGTPIPGPDETPLLIGEIPTPEYWRQQKVRDRLRRTMEAEETLRHVDDPNGEKEKPVW